MLPRVNSSPGVSGNDFNANRGGNNGGRDGFSNVEMLLMGIGRATVESVKIQRTISGQITEMVDSFKKILEFFANQEQLRSIRQEENDLERRAGPAPGNSVNEEIDKLSQFIERIGIATAIAIIGNVMFMLEEEIKKTVETTIASIVTTGKSIVALIEEMPRATIDFIGNLINGIKMRITSAVTKFTDMINDAFKAIEDITSNRLISKSFDFIRTTFSKISAAIGKMADFLQSTFKIFSSGATWITGKLGGALKIIQKGLGKILLPLQILLSAIDFITGFYEGYMKDGWMEGLRTGLQKVFDGLVTNVLNLLLDITTYILDSIGLDGFAETLDKYGKKITENVSKGFASFLDVFTGLLSFDGARIWKGLTGIGSNALDFLTNIANFAINSFLNIFNDIFGFTDNPIDFDVVKFLQGVVEKTVSTIQGFFTNAFDNLGDLTSIAAEKIKQMFNGFLDGLVELTKDFVRNSLETIGATSVANKLLGPAELTQQQIEERAQDIANERVSKDLGYLDKFNMMMGSMKVGVTQEDLNAAVESLKAEGYSAPVKAEDSAQEKIQGLNQGQKPTTSPMITQFNNTSHVGSRGGGAPSVIAIPSGGRASSSTPLARNGGGGF